MNSRKGGMIMEAVEYLLASTEKRLLIEAKEMIRHNENNLSAPKGFEFADFRQVEILRRKVSELAATQA